MIQILLYRYIRLVLEAVVKITDKLHIIWIWINYSKIGTYLFTQNNYYSVNLFVHMRCLAKSDLFYTELYMLFITS
jgi:hypothetical protein